LSFSHSLRRRNGRNGPHVYTDIAALGTRQKSYGLLLLLYLAALTVDAARKVAGLPGSVLAIVYVLTAVTYLFMLPGIKTKIGPVAGYLPVWLVLLCAWCVIEGVGEHVPMSMALLGLSSYVFFVPLMYIGADLMMDDRSAAKALRVLAFTGAAVGLGAVASALLGPSAPVVLQPIVPSAGIHDFNTQSIYLAPSIFATAEEAAEYLLVAFFAWIALAYLPGGRPGRTASTLTGLLIATGLIAAERRADIVVAIVGVLGFMVLRHFVPVRHRTPIGEAPIQQASRRRGRVGPALIIAGVGAAVLISFLGAAKLLPFLTSESSGQDAVAFMFSPAHPGALTGQGTGTSDQGATLVGAATFDGYNSRGAYTGYSLDGRSYVTAEGGLTKTWLEIGLVGVILYASVFFSALGPLIRSLPRLDDVGRALLALSLGLGIVFLKGHQSLDDPLVQPLFWLCVGGAWGRMRSASTSARSAAEATS
jgi:hypothetical protein